MSEDEIREEIVRLVWQKESDLHDLNCLMPSDFDFVMCANLRVKSIDDAPFDANGVSQIYRNGRVLHTPLVMQILPVTNQTILVCVCV